MKKIAIAAILIALATAVRADGIGGGVGGSNGIGNGVGDPSGISATKITLTPQTGAILQADGTFPILSANGVDSICRAGSTC